MIEVTDEMVDAGQAAINYDLGRVRTRLLLAAVAPLIEAQARAEIETITAERNRMVDRYERLEADLAQARAAAIEEADRAIKRAAWMAKHACLVEPDGGSPTQAECDLCDEAERRILSLLSRPVSEREGADTAPAPAKRHEYNEDTGRMEPTDTAPAPADCNNVLRSQNKAYPRTCRSCGLGPCKFGPTYKAPAPAISCGMVSVLQDAYEHMTKHPTGARGWNALLNRMEAALAAADRSAT